MKKILSLILALVLVLSITGCSLDSVIDDATSDIKANMQNAVNSSVENLKENIGSPSDWLGGSEDQDGTNTTATQLTVLNVGQGLSVLIESNGEYALYDGGDRTASSYVVSYLKKHKITKLKYMIASHYDDDHINGLVGVLKNVEVEKIIGPDYTTDTRVYKSFMSEIDNQNKTIIHPLKGDSYTVGNAKLTVLSPSKSFQTDDNNEQSIVMKVKTETYTCLLTGDAGKEAEDNMIAENVNLSADILVVGHHGSNGSTTKTFLNKVNPKTALISVGKFNMYNHPSDKVIDRLTDKGIDIVRTDESGEITVHCTKKSYSITKQK